MKFFTLSEEVQEEMGFWSPKNIFQYAYDLGYQEGTDKGYDEGYQAAQHEASKWAGRD